MLDTKPILLAGPLTAAAGAAAAETCRDLVDRLAEQHALHAAPPAGADRYCRGCPIRVITFRPPSSR